MNNALVLEKGERCKCGGEIDSIYTLDNDPRIKRGQCFVCRTPYTIIQRFGDEG